jgi:hypothetical protein
VLCTKPEHVLDKKHTHKELLNMYFEETAELITPEPIMNKEIIGQFDNLSAVEKRKFEAKFTQPKNPHQHT